VSPMYAANAVNSHLHTLQHSSRPASFPKFNHFFPHKKSTKKFYSSQYLSYHAVQTKAEVQTTKNSTNKEHNINQVKLLKLV